MKKKLLIVVSLVVSIQAIFGQTTEQQRRADAYYQNEQRREELSEDDGSLLLDLLFGSFESSPSSGITADEFNDGGWYAGQYANSVRDGFGTTYIANPEQYIFCDWKNDSINGLTMVVNADYCFFGGCSSNQKNGFGITSWSNEKPLNIEGYSDVIKYVGEYKDGEWHGYGIVYFKDGTYKAGIWEDGDLNEELPKLEVLEALGF